MITKQKEKEKRELRENLVRQAIQEISHSRTYKQGKIKKWNLNEEMYYGKKQVSTDARANVDLARMQEFVHTLLSKIDNPLVFKFLKRKEAQLQRVQNLNALKDYDRQINFWDIKDLVGKKQGIIYGRAIYAYYADSENGYQAHLDNIDVHDFLVDPTGGGLDLEKADYMGRLGVIKTKKDLEAGMKSGFYIKDEVKQLLDGVGNNTEKTQEETNKESRERAQNVVGEKTLQKDDKFKFWEWFTTYESERYYLLMQEGGRCLRCEKLIDLFSSTKQFPLAAWPFWSWAAFLDLTEFWTPSYCDYVREIFMAQNTNINQMLDNAEEYNKPSKVVNVVAIENLNDLKYRKIGTSGNLIKTKGDYDASKVVQVLRPSAIDTPLKVFEALERIQEKALGVTSGAKGLAEDEKVAIYQGNQEAAADRFGLLNKSYSFGYHRFARLYEIGASDNLTKKVAIDIMGPDGIEIREIGKNDVFKKGDEFNVLVEASNAEDLASALTQKIKISFLAGKRNDPSMNPKKAFEIEAKIAGFSDDEIKELMDVENYGSQKIMAEAARDIEALMDGEEVKPNEIANAAYMQKLVDYGRDQAENMTDKQKTALLAYIESLSPIIMRNMAKSLSREAFNMANQPSVSTPAGGSAVAQLPVIPPEKNELPV